MPTVSELINAGYGGYQGWGDAAANADFNATGGAGKQTGGGNGSMSGPTIAPFKFDQSKAEAEALKTLAPYYQKLLDMYGGDVALAKQRLDQDYERGLRIKTDNTVWEQTGNTADKAERMRKFEIALKDIDQQMNQRGLTNSGIKIEEKKRATADEMYQQSQLDRANEQLDKGLQQYTEQAKADYTKEATDLGYIKPTTVATTGAYAPDQTNVTSPGGSFKIENYTSQPAQKQVTLEEQKRKDMIQMTNDAWTKAQAQWMADASRLASTAYAR